MRSTSASVLLFVASLPAIAPAAATSNISTQASVPLTPNDFDAKTKDMSVLIKFFAPWCGHCQKLAPVWEKLANDWIHHEQGLVAEVDCTTSADVEAWCSRHFRIQGFPTILYGDPSHDGLLLKEYHGDKTYDALAKFANETIAKPVCSPTRVDACDRETQDRLKKYLALSPEQIEAEEKSLKRSMEDAQNRFDQEFGRMQSIYDDKKQDYQLFSAKQKRLLKELKAILKEKRKLASQ